MSNDQFCFHGYLFGNGCEDCDNRRNAIPNDLDSCNVLASDLFAPIARTLLDVTDVMRDLRIDVSNPPIRNGR